MENKPKRLSFSRVNGLIHGKCEFESINSVFKGNEATATGQLVEAAVCGEPLDPELMKYFLHKKTGKPKANHDKLVEYIMKLSTNETMKKLLENSEQQVDVDFEIRGIPVKGYADFVTKNAVWDLKVVKSTTDEAWSDFHGMRVPFYVSRFYAMQLAIYCHALDKEKAKLICLSKTTGEVRVIHFSKEILIQAWQDFEQHAEYAWDLITGKTTPKRCEKCQSCIDSRGHRAYNEIAEMY